MVLMLLITLITIFYPKFIFSVKLNYFIDNKNRCNLKYLIARTFVYDDNLLFVNINEFNDVNVDQPHVLFNDNFTGNICTTYFTNFIIFINDLQVFLHQLARLIESMVWNKHLSTRGKFLIVIKDLTDFSDILKVLLNRDIYKILLWDIDTSVVYIVNPYDKNLHLIKRTCIDASFERFKPENYSLIFRRGFFDLPYTGDMYMNIIGFYESSINIIGRHLKVNLTYIYHNDGIYAFEHYAKQSTNLTNTSLHNGEIDIFTTYDFIPHYVENYDVTDAVFRDAEIFVFNKPGPKNNVEILVSIFSLEASTSILFVMLLSAILLWLFIMYDKKKKKMQDFVSCLLLMLGTTVAVTSGLPSKRRIVKILILFYSIYSFHMYNIFQGRFSSLITNPPLKRDIRNLMDLTDSDLTIFVSPRKMKGLQLEDSATARKLLKRYTELNVFFNWIYISLNDTKCASTLYESVLYLYGNDRLKTVEPYYPSYRDVRFGLRKGHPLTEHINNVIGQIVAAGLTKKWLSDLKNVTFYKTQDKNVVLTFQHLYGAIIILIYGYLLSIIIFVFELLYAKLFAKKTLIRIDIM